MAFFVVNAFVSGAGSPIYDLATNDTLVVTRNGTLIASDFGAAAVVAEGSSINVLVDGGLYAPTFGTGIQTDGANTTAEIRVGATGSIFGENWGLRLNGFTFVDNAGTISGGAAIEMAAGRVINSGTIRGVGNGLFANSDGTFVHNSGLIVGAIFGVSLNAGGGDLTGVTTLVNLGTIQGASGSAGAGALVGGNGAYLENAGVILGTFGVQLVAAGPLESAGVTVVNSGRISSTDATSFGAAILGSDRSDWVINTGTLSGAVRLGDGNDTYDNTGGSQLRGNVLGGAGNDTLLGGAGRDVLRGEAGFDSLDGGDGNDVVTGGLNADVLEGGAGTMDLLDYTGSGAVQVNLALGEASGGDAQGDVFSGFEGVAGGNFNDVLTGDGLANLLLGRFGNDVLNGAGGNDNLWGEAGNDTLLGGAGVDLLRGGVGADVFRFAAASDSGAPGQARDRILDFVVAQADRIDLSLIDANAALAGNQAFAFIGGSAFSAAGQVRTQVISGDTFVFGNTDAVLSTSEFSIRLTGTIALTGSEFIL